MFDEGLVMLTENFVMLTEKEYEAYVIACLETEFGAEYPDPALFVTDEQQRFLDSRAPAADDRRGAPGRGAGGRGGRCPRRGAPRPGAGRLRPQPPGGDVRPGTG